MSLRGRLAGLGARFDGQALAPFVPDAGTAAAADWPALQAWCLAGPARPLALAQPAPAAAATAAARAARLALQLDGTHALATCTSSAARLALRLRVKWQDATASPPTGAALPGTRVWDSGRALDPAALARFGPRRPSFVVIDGGDAQRWLQACMALQQRGAALAQPVRVLWLLAPPIGSATALEWTSVPA